MGSHTDRTFFPKRKRVLNLWPSREVAVNEEIRIHLAKNVASNSRYANRANQTSTRFSCPEGWHRKWVEDLEWRGVQLIRLRAQQLKLAETKKETMKGEDNPAKRPEVRKKLSEAQMGEKNHQYGKPTSQKQKEAASKTHKGRPKTKSTKDKMSKTASGRKKITNGLTNTWLRPGSPLPEGWSFVKPPTD
jgi:hypothetical protein